jgi:hypothetical protein
MPMYASFFASTLTLQLDFSLSPAALYARFDLWLLRHWMHGFIFGTHTT